MVYKSKLVGCSSVVFEAVYMASKNYVVRVLMSTRMPRILVSFSSNDFHEFEWGSHKWLALVIPNFPRVHQSEGM